MRTVEKRWDTRIVMRPFSFRARSPLPCAAAARDNRGDGRITVLVSHRFSTVRMADLILVLDGARLVESGSHADLMARGGPYAQLYGIQAAAYR